MASLTVAEAEALILRQAGDFGTEKLPLAQAVGRVLRQHVRSERDHPPYDRAMMDGIAFRAGASFPLTCTGIQPAGAPARALPVLPEGDACIEIMTGAVLPPNADCVVPVERLKRAGDEIFLMPDTPVQAGQFIHPRGTDAQAGSVLLAPGLALNGPALAVLAANGVSEVTVSRLPSVGIISTGDELVEVNAPVESWQVRRSNDMAVLGIVAAQGVRDIQRHWVRDDLEALTQKLRESLAEHDVVVLSGGVSMGAFDHVPRALAEAGVEKILHRIAQRPGGPLWFGVGPQGQRVFGLPGNPVSAMVCAARYLVPLLRAALQAKPEGLESLRLAAPARRLEGRTRFLPVRISGSGDAIACPAPTSGDFMALAETDGIVEIPAREIPAREAPAKETSLKARALESDLPAGATVRFYGW